MLLVLKRTVSMRWSYCAHKTHVNTDGPPSKVEFCLNILSQNISVKSYLFLTEHQTCTVFEGERARGGGGGALRIDVL